MTKVRNYWFRPVPITLLSTGSRSIRIHVLGESELWLGNFLLYDLMPSWQSHGFEKVEVIIYPNFAWSGVRAREGVLDLSLYRRPGVVSAYAKSDTSPDKTILSWVLVPYDVDFTIDHSELDFFYAWR